MPMMVVCDVKYTKFAETSSVLLWPGEQNSFFVFFFLLFILNPCEICEGRDSSTQFGWQTSAADSCSLNEDMPKIRLIIFNSILPWAGQLEAQSTLPMCLSLLEMILPAPAQPPPTHTHSRVWKPWSEHNSEKHPPTTLTWIPKTKRIKIIPFL